MTSTASQPRSEQLDASPGDAGVVAIATGIMNAIARAWNAGDATAFAEVFAPDADFVDIRGVLHRGRADIENGHRMIFGTIYKGSHVAYEVVRGRVLGPGLALAHVRARLDAPFGPLQGTNHATQTVVMTEGTSGWLVTAFHNTLVRS